MTKEWSAGTDRDFVIKGRHSRSYYKHADRWLRNEVAAFRLEHENPAEAARLRGEALQAREGLLATAHEVEA
jgi:hypothetical protein